MSELTGLIRASVSITGERRIRHRRLAPGGEVRWSLTFRR
jgi:hypothetical protein